MDMDDLSFDQPYAFPPPTTFEDWEEFVNRPPLKRPVVPSLAVFSVMSAEEKLACKQERIIYHASFGPIEVQSLIDITDTCIRTARDNLRAPPGARPGVIIDGRPTVGKSTILMQLGRKYELALRKKYGIEKMPSGHSFIPVVYVSLPADTNIKNFNWALANFYGIAAPRSATADYLTRQICRHARLCGTSMTLVDEYHLLKQQNKGSEGVNNHLKYLANNISSTFVYAGVNCEATGLINEKLSASKVIFSQTRKRFKKFDVGPYSIDNPEGRVEWLALLATFDSHLCLVNHVSGTLTALADYIYQRTAGYIGPTSNLIREGANLAIRDGVERISREILDKINLDYDSEVQYRLSTRTKGQQRKRRNSK